MILRRLTQHLKQQHWTGVFIELVIVILGVFIGMQVQDWNAARIARADLNQQLISLRQATGGQPGVFQGISSPTGRTGT